MANPIEVIRRIVEAEQAWGDFIQNGPDDGIGGWVRDKYRERCDQFANLPGWARALSRPVSGSLSRACTPYWNDRGVDGPESRPPFTGGQCVCDAYEYSYVIEGTSDQLGGPFTRQGTRRIRGPLSAPRKANNNSQFEWTANSGSWGVTNNPLACGQPQTVSISAWGFPSSDATVTSLSVTNLSNPGTECGDPPEQLETGPNPPEDPGPMPGPEPTDDPRNPFGPPLMPIPMYDDPVGGPTPIEPPGDAPGGGGDGDRLPGPNPEVGPGIEGGGDGSGTGPGAGGDDFEFGEPPGGRIWFGCIVRITNLPKLLGILPNSTPGNGVSSSVVGNLSLLYDVDGVTLRDSAVQVRSEWSDRFAPVVGLSVSGARVTMNPTLQFTVFPVSVTDPNTED